MEVKPSTKPLGRSIFDFLVGCIVVMICVCMGILLLVGIVKLLWWYILKCWWFWSFQFN